MNDDSKTALIVQRAAVLSSRMGMCLLAGLAPGCAPLIVDALGGDDAPTVTPSSIGGELRAEFDLGSGFEPVESGTAFDFGPRVVGTGSGNPLLLRLSNDGTAAFALQAPIFTGSDAVDFLVQAEPELQSRTQQPNVLPADVEVIDGGFGPGQALRLGPAFVRTLAGEERVRVEGFPLPTGPSSASFEDVTLELERLPSPWARDTQLTLDGELFEGGPDSLLNDFSMWKGRIAGRPASALYLGVSPRGTRGWIRTGAEGTELVHLLDEGQPYVVRAARSADLEEFTQAALDRPACGGSRSWPGMRPLAPLDSLSAGGVPAIDGVPPVAEHEVARRAVPAACRVLFETDHQFFQIFGDVEAATVYVTQLVGAISDLYVEHVQTRIEIASLALYSDPSDPWATPDLASPTLDALLTEFADLRAPLASDVHIAHFLSATAYVDAAGLAFLDALCDPNFGFGVSGFIDGTFDAANFSGARAVSNFDFTTVAHEIGHNFGALHTNEYCPPLDRCAASCVSGPVCQTGTIMSNCNVCPGGELNVAPTLHPFVANEMRLRVNASCLGTALLEVGESTVLTVNFAPTADSGPGAKSSSLDIVHRADNETSPFRIVVLGTAE